MRRLLCLLMVLSVVIFPVSGEEAPKYVALTFDDGPSGSITRRLLEGLAERNVRATFFLCGYRLESYGDVVPQIRAGGHEIGLHGYSHDSMAAMTEGQIGEELEKTAGLLPEFCCLNVMRAPGGRVTDTVRKAAKDAGLSVLGWSVDPRDWQTRDAETVFRRVVSEAEDGDVILMHDMSDSSVDAALAIVDELQARGYRFLTVSQLALLKLRHLTPGEEYLGF